MSAGARGRMPLPGHYAGATSQEGIISFDVSERGWHVSNLLLTVTARSACSEKTVADLPVVVGRIFPVEPGGRWRGTVCGSGITVTIEAYLNGSGIRGDVRVDIESDGEPLTTGPLTWHATTQSA